MYKISVSPIFFCMKLLLPNGTTEIKNLSKTRVSIIYKKLTIKFAHMSAVIFLIHLIRKETKSFFSSLLNDVIVNVTLQLQKLISRGLRGMNTI